MAYFFRQATASSLNDIWEIIACAIERRRQDGSNQWQDGYPNPDVIKTILIAGLVTYLLRQTGVLQDIVPSLLMMNLPTQTLKANGLLTVIL